MVDLTSQNQNMISAEYEGNCQHIKNVSGFFLGVFCCALLVFLFVQLNVFKANVNIDPYSEGFVVRKIQNDVNGTSPRGGFLPLPPGNVAMFNFPSDAYRSNPGWQGTTLSSLRELSSIPVDQFVVISKAIYSFIFFSFFFCFFYWISRVIANPFVIAAAMLFAVICIPFMGFSSNLYWVAFLSYLGPLLIFLIAYRRGKPILNVQSKLILLIAGISVFVRALCGYEWVSFIILNNAWAVCFVLFTVSPRISIAEQIVIVVKVIVCGALGFIAATLVHVLQGYVAWSDMTQAIDPIFSRAIAHAGYVTTANDMFKTFQAPEIAYPASDYLTVFKTYTNLDIFIPFSAPVYWVAICILAFGVLGVRAVRSIYPRQTPMLSLQSLWILCILSYAPPISWIILQPSHAIVHPFINGVTFAAISIPLTVISLLETLRFVGCMSLSKVHHWGLLNVLIKTHGGKGKE